MIRDEETLNILLDSIARFVREVLVPNEALVAETDTIPPAIVAQMRELGLFGLSIPEAYGGLELSMEEEVRVAFEIARTSPAFRSLIGTNNGIGSQGIVIDGTEAQKQYYLPKLAAGEIIGSFALTEAGSGSDAASLRTTAVRDGDFYILNGSKRYITNAPEASIFTVMAARTVKRGASAISAFIVERTRPASRWEKSIKRWASKGRTPATSSSKLRAGREPHRRQGRRGLQDGHEGARQGPPAHRRRLRGRGRAHAG
jgi:acyl-CoA dehydrogenase